MYKDLKNSSRILLEVELRPVQGQRFQPTGFPDLGAAEFTDSQSKNHLLVESAQSMANRLEKVIWDDGAADVVEALQGLPYVKSQSASLGATNSILEAHRLNSPYIVDSLEDEIVSELDWNRKVSPDLRKLAKYLIKRDPNSLIHGTFFSSIKPGTLRLPRLLSAFIEAEDVNQAASGGVKFDRLDAKGEAKDGKGHVPFHRVEYTAQKIVAYFNFDLYQLRSFGLTDDAEAFLISLALYKIRRFLDMDLRLRTACDFDVVAINSKRPEGFELPDEQTLAQRLRDQIKTLTASGEFANPPVHEVATK